MLGGDARGGLVHHVEEDDGLYEGSLVSSGRLGKDLQTYVHRIDVRHSQEVRPVGELYGLLAHAASKHAIGKFVDVSQLIMSEDEQLPTPHLRLRCAVFDLILETRHDPEVVACALQGPQ